MKNKFTMVFFFLLSTCSIYAQNAAKVRIPPIPKDMHWVNTPLDWNFSNDGVLIINCGKGSRLFTDPQQIGHDDTAPILLFKPDETFLLSCKVKVEFNSVFDAGVLMIYGNTHQWAKFCFEYSPDLKPMVVSVVNNNLSDDSNHEILDNNEIYMRIAGFGNGAYAFHFSHNGEYWNMARYFYLDPKNDLKIGFLSQSPLVDSCKSVFSEITYTSEKLKGLRTGE